MAKSLQPRKDINNTNNFIEERLINDEYCNQSQNEFNQKVTNFNS